MSIYHRVIRLQGKRLACSEERTPLARTLRRLAEMPTNGYEVYFSGSFRTSYSVLPPIPAIGDVANRCRRGACLRIAD
jgi:hypothetical protein